MHDTGSQSFAERIESGVADSSADWRPALDRAYALALDYLWRVHLPDPSDELHGGRELSESEAAQL